MGRGNMKSSIIILLLSVATQNTKCVSATRNKNLRKMGSNSNAVASDFASRPRGLKPKHVFESQDFFDTHSPHLYEAHHYSIEDVKSQKGKKGSIGAMGMMGISGKGKGEVGTSTPTSTAKSAVSPSSSSSTVSAGKKGTGKGKGMMGKGKSGGAAGRHGDGDIVLNFIQHSANATLPVDGSSDSSQIGTRYIFNSCFDADTEMIPTRRNERLVRRKLQEGEMLGYVTGGCTRTGEMMERIDGGERQTVQTGYCDFVYADLYGNSISAHGKMYDIEGGTLAITGGTYEFKGAYGEVVLMPVYSNGGTDIFDDVDRYEGTLNIFEI